MGLQGIFVKGHRPGWQVSLALGLVLPLPSCLLPRCGGRLLPTGSQDPYSPVFTAAGSRHPHWIWAGQSLTLTSRMWLQGGSGTSALNLGLAYRRSIDLSIGDHIPVKGRDSHPTHHPDLRPGSHLTSFSSATNWSPGLSPPMAQVHPRLDPWGSHLLTSCLPPCLVSPPHIEPTCRWMS